MQRPRFECPRVPYVGIYGIVFFDENNCELPTPAALLCGIRVPAAFPRRIVSPRGHKKKAVSEQPADQGNAAYVKRTGHVGLRIRPDVSTWQAQHVRVTR